MITDQIRPPVHVVIIGASGHARVIADIIYCSGDVVEGFLDDGNVSDFPGQKILGHVADALQMSQRDPNLRFIIGIGRNETRESIVSNLGDLPYYIAIDPSAIISDSTEIGEGSVVMPNTVVNSGSRIGRHCIINTAATVDHDCKLLDFVHLSPGVHLSGTVQIGNRTWLGVGSIVINNISICDNCIVGAGAAVIRDISEPGTYVGVPARKAALKF
jgi:sugar O-acyltransferase (sialic acid O-acetyltransferase NeuD family)